MNNLTEREIWANTPCFVLDENDLSANLKALKRALEKNWSNYQIGYSYKTCAIAWLLDYMKKNNVKAEVVSAEEFALAKKIGYATQDIIYNGPIKTKQTLAETMLAHSVVNLDSNREIIWAKEIAGQNPDKEFFVGLRVNFDLGEQYQVETVAGKAGNRFGFSLEKGFLEQAIKTLHETCNLKVRGLHMHVSSKTRDAEIYRKLAGKAVQIADKYHLVLNYIDIGGGFFAGGEFNDKFDLYFECIAEELGKRYDISELVLIVEPGASLIASPVSLYSRVIDVKDNLHERLIITDASRCLIDPFMHKTNYQYRHMDASNNEFLYDSLKGFLPEELLKSAEYKKVREEQAFPYSQTICGYTCMENDRLMTLNNVKPFKMGDGIIYNTVGSYTICFNPLFIRYLPAVYLKQKETYTLIRRRWETDDFLIGQVSQKIDEKGYQED